MNPRKIVERWVEAFNIGAAELLDTHGTVYLIPTVLTVSPTRYFEKYENIQKRAGLSEVGSFQCSE